MKKLSVGLLAVILTFVVPYGAAKGPADWMMKWLDERFSLSQAGWYFTGALTHRVIHFAIAIALLLMIYGFEDARKRFDFGNLKNDLSEFRWIIMLWPILTVIFFIGSMLMVDGFGDYLSRLYQSTDGWLLARVGRDFMLIDAIPEEVFYRGVMIGLLSLGFKKSIRVRKFQISHAALLSVPLFALSHVQISTYPFSIVQYDTIQLGLTVLTGLLFGYAYEKTRSLVLPILLHGYTNLVITVSAYVILKVFHYV